MATFAVARGAHAAGLSRSRSDAFRNVRLAPEQCSVFQLLRYPSLESHREETSSRLPPRGRTTRCSAVETEKAAEPVLTDLQVHHSVAITLSLVV